MIHYIQCLKARDDLSVLDFRSRFREYAGKMRDLAAAIGATEVEASTTLAVEANSKLVAERGTQAPYDAVLEVYLPNAGVLQALEGTEAAGLVDDLQAFQETFVDLSRSSFFFTSVDEG